MHSLPTILLRNSQPRLHDIDSAISRFFQDAPAYNQNYSKGFPIDVEETEDSYAVYADLPGVKKDEIEVTLDKNVLTIQVNASENKEEGDRNFVLKERSRVTMARKLSLALASGDSEVDAKLEEGILTVSVKKSPEKKLRKVAVR
jgi:HSP20 family protein